MSKHEIGCLKHCTGGDHGSSLFGGAGAILAIVAALVLYHARRGIAIAGEVVMVTMAVVFVLAVAAGLGWAGLKIYRAIRSPRVRQTALPLTYRVTQIGTHTPEAIEPSRVHDVDWASVKVGVPVPREVRDGYYDRNR